MSMLDVNMIKVEMERFFTRKYKLAMLALASYAALC